MLKVISSAYINVLLSGTLLCIPPFASYVKVYVPYPIVVPSSTAPISPVEPDVDCDVYTDTDELALAFPALSYATTYTPYVVSFVSPVTVYVLSVPSYFLSLFT